MTEKGKVIYIHNAIEVDNFKYEQEVEKKYRKEFGLENKFVVGCVGRFAYQKNYEQYVKNGTEIEDTEIKNRFEIRMKNERAYYAVVDLLTYRDAERTAFSIINHYVRFVDREDDKPKSQWITNDDWAWFVGENREPIRLTTKPEPYTLQKALHWLQRQVAPTIKMVQALDRENHTTILKDMIEQAELKDKHKHLLQLEKSTIEERIDTAVPQENDGIF